MMTNQRSALTTVVSYPERGEGGNNKYRGNCSPRDAVFVYSGHTATTKMRKGAIKNAETMPRQLWEGVPIISPVRSVTMQDPESGILISTSSAMCSDAPNAASLKAVSFWVALTVPAFTLKAGNLLNDMEPF